MASTERDDLVHEVQTFLDGSPIKIDVKSLDNEWYQKILEESQAKDSTRTGSLISSNDRPKVPKL